MTVTGPAAGSASSDGLTFLPSSGGVVGLNYYDGRFLRADDLNLERRGQREYVELSNRAVGSGPVWGFDLSGLGTGELRLSAGLALSPRGQVLYLPDDARAPVADLLAAGSSSTVPASGGMPTTASGFVACGPSSPSPGGGGTVVAGTALYLVCLSPASRPQGVSEVFGRLCEGCVTATDSPYLVDGVTLQLRPLGLDLQPWTAAGVTRPDLHLRSQVASAYFEVERQAAGPAMSAALLASAVWSAGAASLAGDDAVAVGVLGWDGAGILLLDPWTARRENMQAPPDMYWAGRFERRPWPVFLAQVLQFQAQLATAPQAPGGSVRQLVDRGFVELPAAGYLPLPAGTADLHGVLAAQFGPGVELRLCAVRRDQIPREFERGRHRDRISLLRGLLDATAREQVDVFVPDGLVVAAQGGLEFTVDLAVGPGASSALEDSPAPRATARGRGAARLEPGPGIDLRVAAALAMPRWGETFGRFLRGRQEGVTGFEAFVAGTRTSPPVGPPDVQQLRDLATRVEVAAAGAGTRRMASVGVAVGTFRVLAAAASLTVDADPFGLPDGGSSRFTLDASGYQPSRGSSTSALLQVSGTVMRVFGTAGGAVTVAATGVFGITETGSGGGSTGNGGIFENRTLVLTRTAGNGTTITAADPESGLVLELHWSGDPVRADLELRTGESGTEAGPAEGGETEHPPVAVATATQDSSVLRTGNVYHDTAASALAMLAAAHPDDPQYAERAYRELFPSGDTTTATVQAHRDWVLFRRRDRKDCEGAPVTANPGDTVTVQVLAAKDAAEAATAVDAVLSGTGKDWPTGWTATEVVFDGGTTTLLTPAPTWQQRYLDAGGADAVALAGYAAAAGSLGALVGVGRLNALLAALAPDVTLDPGAPTAPVNPPDQLQPATGTDGTAFLVTHPPAPTPVPLLAVRALSTDDNAATIARLKQPDPTLVTDADPFAALGEGGTSTLDVSRVVSELATLEGDVSGMEVSVETVLWTFAPVAPGVAEDLAELAREVESAVGAMTKTTVVSGQRFGVAFTRTDGDLDAQLFLLVTISAEIN
jgi:hypothetical protein